MVDFVWAGCPDEEINHEDPAQTVGSKLATSVEAAAYYIICDGLPRPAEKRAAGELAGACNERVPPVGFIIWLLGFGCYSIGSDLTVYAARQAKPEVAFGA